MKITFEPEDNLTIAKKLREAGLEATDERLASVKYNVEAAFQQQLDDETDWMVSEFEADDE